MSIRELELSIKLGGADAPGLASSTRTRAMSSVVPGERPAYADAREVRGVPGLWLRPINIRVDGVEVENGNPPLESRQYGYFGELGAFVLVHFRVPERDTGRELSLTYRKRINPFDMSPDYLAHMVTQALSEVMQHETDEMLFAGAAVRRDPHPNDGQEPV